MTILMTLASFTGLINAAIVLLVGANAAPFPRLCLYGMAIFGAFASAALFGTALNLAGVLK